MRKHMKVAITFLLAMSFMVTGCNRTTSVTTDTATETTSQVKENTQKNANTEKEKGAVLIYTSNANADGFLVEVDMTSKVTARSVFQSLKKHGMVPNEVKLNQFTTKEKDGKRILTLDLSKEFLDYVRRMGTSEEYLTMQGIVNTYLIAFDGTHMQITVDGKEIETGHNIYDEPMGFTVSLPENMEKMMPVFDSLMRCMTEQKMSYDPTNHDFIWSSIFYLAGGYGELDSSSSIQDGELVMSKKAVTVFAKALFEEIDSLPDIPQKEKNMVRYDKDTKKYYFQLGDIGLSETKVIQCEAGEKEGSYVVYAELLDPIQHTKIKLYKFIVKPLDNANMLQTDSSNGKDKNTLFHYSISSVEEVKML